MPQQQTLPLVVPEDIWYNVQNMSKLAHHKEWFTQIEWMIYRKDHKKLIAFGLSPAAIQAELEKHYIINDLDIREIHEQEAAGNYFLMSLYVNTMVFDKEAL